MSGPRGTGFNRTSVVALGVVVTKETCRSTIEDLERVRGRLARFRVHAVDDVVGKCKLHWFLDDGLGSDGVITTDQPNRNTRMEKVIADFHVSIKTTDPFGPDREGVGGWIHNVGLDVSDVVKECYDV